MKLSLLWLPLFPLFARLKLLMTLALLAFWKQILESRLLTTRRTCRHMLTALGITASLRCLGSCVYVVFYYVTIARWIFFRCVQQTIGDWIFGIPTSVWLNLILLLRQYDDRATSVLTSSFHTVNRRSLVLDLFRLLCYSAWLHLLLLKVELLLLMQRRVGRLESGLRAAP